tara:strand:- start:21678 stop:22691 length:1014 start_codon:yes stop_codon:yes gene_type:complete
MSVPSVSRDFTKAVFDYLAECGFAADTVMRCAGLDSLQLLPGGRVPLNIYEKLFLAGENLSGDHYFGLNMGARPWPRSWGLVSHLAVSAPDAVTAASALMDYSELQLNFLRFRLRQLAGGRMCMEVQHDGVARLQRHVVEHLLANIVTLASTQIGYEIPELQIELAHGDAGDAAYVSRMLNAKVTFECEAYRVEASQEFLQQQALYGEEDLYRVTEQLARQRLMELRGEDRFLNQVRETVLQQLPGGLPKVDGVAAILGLSARTLQRRLQERNLRYQQVLDEVRSELALQLIGDDDRLSLNEVAAYLGFNDQSAMQHAFRRWQGMTPGQYRKRIGTS